jgi:hypothetical protein
MDKCHRLARCCESALEDAPMECSQRRVMFLTSSGMAPESREFSKRRTSGSAETNNQSMRRVMRQRHLLSSDSRKLFALDINSAGEVTQMPSFSDKSSSSRLVGKCISIGKVPAKSFERRTRLDIRNALLQVTPN